MHVKFTGDPRGNDDSQQIEMFGVVFERHHAVDVSHLSDEQQAKLAANSHFTVLDAARRKPGRPRKDATMSELDGQDQD